MSRLFGPMTQLGYVVRDIHEAMDWWIKRGVGPFFHEARVEWPDFVHDGTTHDLAAVSIACGNAGDMQIELIEILDDTPTMYAEFVAKNGYGLQHWATWPVDYDEKLGRALAEGWVVGQSGDSVRGKFAYLRDPEDPTMAIELTEASPERMRTCALVREAAQDWDGSDPIRVGFP